MTMQRVQLDISSDIFDKVMFFLENLPKNKIKLDFENMLNPHSPKQESQDLLFGEFLNHSQKISSITKFDRDELHER